MATLDVDVTIEWVDIKTSLSLTAGNSYVVDNVTQENDNKFGGPVYIREGDTEPSSQFGHRIGLNESRIVTVTAEKLWIRSSTAGSKVVLTVEV